MLQHLAQQSRTVMPIPPEKFMRHTSGFMKKLSDKSVAIRRETIQIELAGPFLKPQAERILTSIPRFPRQRGWEYGNRQNMHAANLVDWLPGA